jgi:uncharacterized membrane protein
MSHISTYLCIFVEIFIYLSAFKWKETCISGLTIHLFMLIMFNFEKQEFSVLFEVQQLEAYCAN